MTRWTEAEITLLRERYPDTDTNELADLLGRARHAVVSKAAKLGIAKSPEALSQTRAKWSATAWFKPGQTPWNKGLKGWKPPGVETTRFQPGNRPHTWRPIGSIAKNGDGIWTIKLREKTPGQPANNIIPLHVHLWEQAHGQIPDGHVVRFKDGNSDHVELDNLELVSRAEHLERNSVHRFPKELREIIAMKARLTRVINQQQTTEEPA